MSANRVLSVRSGGIELRLETGGCLCLWMTRMVEPLGAFRRCDFLYLRAAVLAADGRPDADVLSALGAAVNHGFMPSEETEARNWASLNEICEFTGASGTL